MKKLLALLLSVAMFVLPMSAFAAEEVTPAVDYVANTVTIAGQADESLVGRIATLVIVNPGMDIANFADDGVIAWADQAIIAADGSFSFTVDMTYTESGDDYGVYVTVSGSDDSFEGTFDYDVEIIDVALTEVANDCRVKAAMDEFIRETAKTALEAIDEDLVEDYIDLKSELNVAADMVGKKPFADMEDFADALRDLVDKQAKKEAKQGGGSGGGNDGPSLVVSPELIVDKPVVTNPFVDIADDFWGKDAVIGLYDKDIVAGAGDGYFRPNNTITRAEFVQMVVKAFGFGMNGDAANFADVQNVDWFSKAVQIAYTNGVVNGTSETTFSPNANITRQDMMVILTNAAEAIGKNLTAGNTAFADADSISAYAKDAVAKMTGSGIVFGADGNVNPLANATRAEAAAMLARLLNVK